MDNYEHQCYFNYNKIAIIKFNSQGIFISDVLCIPKERRLNNLSHENK